MKENRFGNVTVIKEQFDRIEFVRDEFGHLLDNINNSVPNGREKSLMLTKLEEACMWATKGISREENKEEK